LNLASRDSECLGSRTSDVEANFHSVRNTGVWHFRWDLGICLSARSDKAIIRPGARAGPVIRPEWSFENSSAFRERIPCGTESSRTNLFYRERQPITANQELPQKISKISKSIQRDVRGVTTNRSTKRVAVIRKPDWDSMEAGGRRESRGDFSFKKRILVRDTA
jgi:hypothetical protein